MTLADTVALGVQDAMMGPDGTAYQTVMTSAQALGEAAAAAIAATIAAAGGGSSGGGSYDSGGSSDASGETNTGWTPPPAPPGQPGFIDTGSGWYNPITQEWHAMAKGGTAYANRPHWVGEEGPELFVPGVTGVVIPHEASTRLLGNAQARQAMVGQYATPTNITYNHTQDYSVRVTGPITVQSQNPDDMAAKLAARQRRQRLANPVGAR
jgi:hypothetical protein